MSTHADVVKQTVARKSLVLGLQHYSRADLEAKRQRVHAGRKVSHWTDEADGGRCGFWKMTTEASAEIESVLDDFTTAVFRRAYRTGQHESHDAYRADALLAMARAARSYATGSSSGRGSRRCSRGSASTSSPSPRCTR